MRAYPFNSTRGATSDQREEGFIALMQTRLRKGNTVDEKRRFNTWVTPNCLRRLVKNTKRSASELITGHGQVLEMMVHRASLEEIFSLLVKNFEAHYRGDVMCLVMLYEAMTDSLRPVSSSGLNDKFLRGIEGLPAQNGAGSCGSAAHYRKRIFVRDVYASPLCHEYLPILKENKIRSCCSQPILGADGRLMGVFSILLKEKRDLTTEELKLIEAAAHLMSIAMERQENEFALVESEEKYRSIFDTAGTPIILTDKHLNVTDMNPAMENLFGYSRHDVLGTRATNYLSTPAFLPQILAEASALMTSGGLSALEVPVKTKDGHERFFLWNFSRLRIGGEREYGLVCVGQDITDRKEVERELMKSKAEAEAANEAKSHFVANMNHELRTPLAAITGLVDMLVASPAVNHDLNKSRINKIKKNINHLLAIVDDLLDLSKVETGKFRVAPAPIALETFLDDALMPHFSAARSKGVNFEIHRSSPLPEIVHIDAVRLRQITNNVVGNAIKFTESGGRVDVSVSVEEIENGGHYVLRMKVTDEGCGIEEHHKDEIFKPFIQADSSSSRKYEGTGLGLSIARQLARALGGEVRLEDSSPGKGSVFSFEVVCEKVDGVSQVCSLESRGLESYGFKDDAPGLPNENGKIAHDPDFFVSETSSTTAGTLKVLLVEDQPDLQLVTQHQLMGLGDEVDVVENGVRAVESALSKKYDVILMDIQMPIMDGYKAVRKLRESGYNRPIIALTARSLKSEVSQYAEQGFNQYLIKPVSHGALSQALEPYRQMG